MSVKKRDMRYIALYNREKVQLCWQKFRVISLKKIKISQNRLRVEKITLTRALLMSSRVTEEKTKKNVVVKS